MIGAGRRSQDLDWAYMRRSEASWTSLRTSCALDLCPVTTGNSHHFYNETSSTEVLHFNKLGYNLSLYGKMAAITYMKIEQNYSKDIFNESISQNLQPIRNNERNIKYHWIIFTMSLLFLYRQLYNRRSKVVFVIISLIQFTIAFHSLKFVCHSKPSLNTILRNSPTKEFFTTEVLRITYKINEFSADMYFKLFTISKMKNKYNRLYLKIILILSGDIELNPGPVDRNQIKKEDFEVFNNKGLHFMHLNINGLLNKIDELRYIARSSNAAVIGITETKLGNTVYDSEVTVDGYNIVRNDRNRNGGGVACYIRNNICFNRKNCLSDNIENIFIDLLFPKTKPISVGIIYKPPSQSQFLQQIITEFEALDLDNEIYVLGDFNINLLFRDKYVLNKSNEI